MATYGVGKYGTAKYGVAGPGGGGGGGGGGTGWGASSWGPSSWGSLGSPAATVGVSGPFDPIYILRIADLTGTVIEEVPYNNLQYGYRLNEPGTLQWVMPIRHPKCTKTLLDPGKREVHLYRNGIRVWGGYLWGVGSTDSDNVRFACEGFGSRLSKWAHSVNKTYTNVDQIDIAWDLINTYQANTNANMGFTRGSASLSGFVRTIKWLSYERPFVQDAIEEMALDDDGFDWEIDQFKAFNTFYKNRGTTRPDVIFELGKNVVGLSIDIDATSLANNFTGLGSGDGANMCVAVTIDATSQAAYGRLDGVISLQELRTFASLQRRTDAELRIYKNPRWQPQLSLQMGTDASYGGFSLGDLCRTIAHYGYMEVDQSFRVIAKEYQLSNEGREQCSVYLDVTPLP